MQGHKTLLVYRFRRYARIVFEYRLIGQFKIVGNKPLGVFCFKVLRDVVYLDAIKTSNKVGCSAKPKPNLVFGKEFTHGDGAIDVLLGINFFVSVLSTEETSRTFKCYSRCDTP